MSKFSYSKVRSVSPEGKRKGKSAASDAMRGDGSSRGKEEGGMGAYDGDGRGEWENGRCEGVE